MPLTHDPDGVEVAALHEAIPSFRGLRVLEVGCGDGRLTRRYAGGAASVLALDPDDTSIAACRLAVANLPVEARALDFSRFDAPPGSFDVVLLSWSL